MEKPEPGISYLGVECNACGKPLMIDHKTLNLKFDEATNEVRGPLPPNATFDVTCDQCGKSAFYLISEIRRLDAHHKH